MGDKTKIEWTEATWNPVTGCTKVSQGCKNCYAERDFARLRHLPAYKWRAFTDVACHTERLTQPLRWKRPRKIFVNSMSDLFHDDVPDEFIDQVFAIMAICGHHTFQVLTKRPERMREYLKDLHSGRQRVMSIRQSTADFLALAIDKRSAIIFPLPNVWLGVSVEDQQTADERIPLLLQTPAAVRWVSAEPLLGPMDLCKWVYNRDAAISRAMNGPMACNRDQAEDAIPRPIDWVVVGGESGPKARPMHPDWARSIRDQCKAAGVPFLFQQWGEWAPNCLCGREKICKTFDRPSPGNPGVMFRCGKRAAGRLLDEVLHDEYTDDKRQ